MRDISVWVNVKGIAEGQGAPPRRPHLFRCLCLGGMGDGGDKLSEALESMRTGRLIPAEVFFEPNLPTQRIPPGRLQRNLDRAKNAASESAQGTDIFMDCSAGEERGPEWASGVTTCITPSHKVYSERLQRFLCPSEFLKLQGIWPTDVSDWEGLTADPVLAQSFAGNAFTSAVSQAMLVASLATSPAWHVLGARPPLDSIPDKYLVKAPAQPATREEDLALVQAPPPALQTQAKRAHGQEDGLAVKKARPDAAKAAPSLNNAFQDLTPENVGHLFAGKKDTTKAKATATPSLNNAFQDYTPENLRNLFAGKKDAAKGDAASSRPSRKRTCKVLTEGAAGNQLVPGERTKGAAGNKLVPGGRTEGAAGNTLVPGGRRLRRKTKPNLAQKRARAGTIAGNKKAKGKKRCITIWDKEMLFQEYERIVQSGVEKPMQAFERLKRKGYFCSAFCESKWGRARREQHWTLFCKLKPELAKKCEEVPAAVRDSLGLPLVKGKLQSGAKKPATNVAICIPPALELTVEHMVMDRMALGEEVPPSFMEETLKVCASVWNDGVDAVNASIQSANRQSVEATGVEGTAAREKLPNVSLPTGKSLGPHRCTTVLYCKYCKYCNPCAALQSRTVQYNTVQ